MMTITSHIGQSEDQQSQDADQRHVVILVHGIRDFALWQAKVRSALEEEGFKTEATNYGRFNLVQFLIPVSYFRKKAIASVWNQIRIIKQNNEGAKLSIIAHSFGTYVVAHLMQENFDIRFHRVIFCGSVVRYGFPFEQIQGRFVQPIINEVGTRDVWPAIAESVTFGYGSAGTYGFRRPLVRDRWHNGASHGYFLDSVFCKKFWNPFLRDGTFVAGAAAPESPRGWLRLLSIFQVKYCVIALMFLSLVASIFNLALRTSPPQEKISLAIIDFVGEWINRDPGTRGITRLRFQEDGSNLTIHVWGSCRPIDCDWGTAEAKVFTQSVMSQVSLDVASIEALYTKDYADTRLAIRPLDKDTLTVELTTHFKDNSGRSDFQNTNIVRRKH